MSGYCLGLDSLYLMVKPAHNLYPYWAAKVPLVDQNVLRAGVELDREGFLARLGSNGYQLSLWRGDARIYLAKRDDMGMWVQLGPIFLSENKDRLRVAVFELLEDVGVPAAWRHPDAAGHRLCEISINRVDVACDVVGHDLGEMSSDEWFSGWVGWSRKGDSYREMGNLKGGLETVYIGSPKSTVRLRVYNKGLEARKGGTLDFWREVWGVAAGAEVPPVTRVEWQVRLKGAGFEGLDDFYGWSGVKELELLNYLCTWGSLRVPGADTNPSRWSLHFFWSGLLAAVEEFGDGVSHVAARVHKRARQVGPAYVKFFVGTLAGGMARLGQSGASLVDMFEYLEAAGFGQDVVRAKGDKVFRRRVLLGLQPAPLASEVMGGGA